MRSFVHGTGVALITTALIVCPNANADVCVYHDPILQPNAQAYLPPPRISNILHGSLNFNTQSDTVSFSPLPTPILRRFCLQEPSYEVSINTGVNVVGGLVLWPKSCVDIDTDSVTVAYTCTDSAQACALRRPANDHYKCKRQDGTPYDRYTPGPWVEGFWLQWDAGHHPHAPEMPAYFRVQPRAGRQYLLVSAVLHSYQICTGGALQVLASNKEDGSSTDSSITLNNSCAYIGGESIFIDTSTLRTAVEGKLIFLQ